MTKQSTDRDNWIIAGALAFAIVALEQLPQEHQPVGDMDDMRRVLGGGDPRTVSLLLAVAKCRLFPDRDPIAIYREYGVAPDEIDALDNGSGSLQ
jgi:hypothetical protein